MILAPQPRAGQIFIDSSFARSVVRDPEVTLTWRKHILGFLERSHGVFLLAASAQMASSLASAARAGCTPAASSRRGANRRRCLNVRAAIAEPPAPANEVKNSEIAFWVRPIFCGRSRPPLSSPPSHRRAGVPTRVSRVPSPLTSQPRSRYRRLPSPCLPTHHPNTSPATAPLAKTLNKYESPPYLSHARLSHPLVVAQVATLACGIAACPRADPLLADALPPSASAPLPQKPKHKNAR